MLNIKQIRESKNITQDEMVSKTGIPKRSYVDYENEKQDVPLKRLRKIATALDVTISDIVGEIHGVTTTSKIGIPLIPSEAIAGFGQGESQIMDCQTERYVVPEFEELNVDFMIRVKGSSMYPKYSSGDLVACKKLPMNDLFFQWHKVYVLDTQQGPLIKRIDPGEDNEHILIVSENKSYKPFQLHLRDIYAVAIVVGVIRFE